MFKQMAILVACATGLIILWNLCGLATPKTLTYLRPLPHDRCDHFAIENVSRTETLIPQPETIIFCKIPYKRNNAADGSTDVCDAIIAIPDNSVWILEPYISRCTEADTIEINPCEVVPNHMVHLSRTSDIVALSDPFIQFCSNRDNTNCFVFDEEFRSWRPLVESVGLITGNWSCDNATWVRLTEVQRLNMAGLLHLYVYTAPILIFVLMGMIYLRFPLI